ncbi:MAG: hypothetical protein ACE5IZ_09160 [Dehalococcoidia bacterium]
MEGRQEMGIPAVVVIEEHGLFRGGLRTVLEGGGLRLVGEYSSPEAALHDEANLGELEPQTVVLCSRSAEGWRPLAHRLVLQTPECRLVGVADEVTDAAAVEALSHGMVGCVSRSLPPQEWVDTVREAYEGTLSPSRTMTRYQGVARHALVTLSRAPQPEGMAPLAPTLGHRERLALANLSEGVPLETIGERMGLEHQGVHDVLESACRKLVARHRLEGVLERLR